MTASLSPAPKRRLLAVVPAYNEEGSIDAVIREARALPDRPDVVVIDDGSSDGTAEVARSAGADVLRMPFNCGIGASVQAGVALGLARGYEMIVRFDGDGQHDPAQIPKLVAAVESGEADFVLGSRYLGTDGYQSTFMRRLGARWFSVLLRVFCGIAITDPTSGFWAANRRAAAVVEREYSSDYPEVDSIVSLRRHDCRVRESAVTMRERAGGRSSIQGLRVLYYMLKVTIALLIGRVRARATTHGG